MWMTFGRRGVLTDGVIDLRPFQGYPPLKSMRFGEMHDYRITLHGRHREIGQIRRIKGINVTKIGFIAANGFAEREEGYDYYTADDLYM